MWELQPPNHIFISNVCAGNRDQCSRCFQLGSLRERENKTLTLNKIQQKYTTENKKINENLLKTIMKLLNLCLDLSRADSEGKKARRKS